MEITREYLLGLGFVCKQADGCQYYQYGDIALMESFDGWLPLTIKHGKAQWAFDCVTTREQVERLVAGL